MPITDIASTNIALERRERQRHLAKERRNARIKEQLNLPQEDEEGVEMKNPDTVNLTDRLTGAIEKMLSQLMPGAKKVEVEWSTMSAALSVVGTVVTVIFTAWSAGWLG